MRQSLEIIYLGMMSTTKTNQYFSYILVKTCLHGLIYQMIVIFYIFKILEKNRIKVQVRKYAPLVFHHIRKIDNINIQEVLQSLDPEKNLDKIKESFASGGRSANPILFTHDKRYLIKTISKEEKNIFIKLLPEFHRRMRDSKTLMCRIYGMFRVKVGDKEIAHVILMRNMGELPNDVLF